MQPLAWIYGVVSAWRRKSFNSGKRLAYKAPVPVIVIGNIYVGGTGKTPLACEISQILREQGWHPGLVSRGFGRQESKTVAVGRGMNLDWRQFGDEPALIARKSAMPVSVHQDRARACKALLAAYPAIDIIISDDGLQHYRLARDVEILVQDERGVGNGLLLPAGPLREPPTRLAQVDLVLTRVTLEGLEKAKKMAQINQFQLPEGLDKPNIAKAAFSLQIDGFWQPSTGQTINVDQFVARTRTQQPVAAIAGIGVPQRFFTNLTELGISVQHSYALSDHAAIDPQWVEGLSAETILITEKDAVKLPQNVATHKLWVAQTSVRWGYPDIKTVLSEKLARVGTQHLES